MYRLSYEELRYKMSSYSKGIGIAAIVSAFILPGFFILPMGLGALAILLAILSKGYNYKLGKNEKLGVILGSIAIGISVLISAYAVTTVISHPDELREIVESADSIYGEDYKEIYGKSLMEMYDELLGETVR